MRSLISRAIIPIVAVGMVAYQFAYNLYPIEGTILHRTTHLLFACLLIWLVVFRDSKRTATSVFALLALLLSVGTVLYTRIFADTISYQFGTLTTADMIVAIIVIVVILEACRRSFGPIIPAVAVLLLLYGFFGHYIPEPIGHMEMSVEKVLFASVFYFSSNSMFGGWLSLAADYIFLFIVLGGLFQACKATDFIMWAAQKASGRLRSGGGMTAVISSALMGTCLGQAVTNVALTGSFTIPMMKRLGYHPKIAGAIETAASTGGQIMPPIMASAAFVMADFLGKPYVIIMAIAFLPALLFFLCVGAYVHLQACKLKVKKPEPTDIQVSKDAMARGPIFIVPLILIVILLVMGYSPSYAGMVAIASALFLTFVRKRTRVSLGELVNGFVQGASSGARITMICVAMAPVAALTTYTMLGYKISSGVAAWTGGNLFIALILMALVAIIIGLEVPTVAAYIITAIIAAPVLITMGLEPVQAHFFVFYFAIFSTITPPVGSSAIVASRIANAGYLETAWEAMKAGVAAWIIPFVIAATPALLMEGPILWRAIVFALTLLALVTLQTAFAGYFLTDMKWYERFFSVAITGSLIAVIVSKIYLILGLACLLSIFLVVSQLRTRRAEERKAIKPV